MTARSGPVPRDGAEALLLALRTGGVDWLFANSGTTLAPVIEALATLPAAAVPNVLAVPHEATGVAMAHGYWLVSGRTQAVMVHAGVGLANALAGLMNAGSDNIPMLVMAGRSPLSESGHPGGRSTAIQYGQEMVGQSQLVADVTKWRHELAFPDQAECLTLRALAIATAPPAGPVYLSLPRETLMERVSEMPEVCLPPRVAAPVAEREAIERAAKRLARARSPLIVTQRGDPSGRLAAEVDALAAHHAIPVVDPFPLRNVLSTEHPMFIGHDVRGAVERADVILVVDAAVPWLANGMPLGEATLIHLGVDPLFARMPLRGHRMDQALIGEPAATLAALARAMPTPGAAAAQRFEEIEARSGARRALRRRLSSAGGGGITRAFLSACLSDVLGEDGVIFNEYGILASFMTLAGPNRLFNPPHACGLGWCFGAALGAQLAAPERLVVAAMGDGSYMFANPPACHQVAEAHDLPVLVVVANNRRWQTVRESVLESYPRGAARRLEPMPLTAVQPQPDFCAIAAASRAHVERVSERAGLAIALARAVEVVRRERRQAFVEVYVEADA